MVRISVTKSSTLGLQIQEILNNFLPDYPQKYLFTNDIKIEENTIPHSHPVLTIGTHAIYIKNPDVLLSTFLHEQIHWYLTTLDLSEYFKILESRYPNIGAGSPNWAATQHSSYLHIIVNFMELDILEKIIGQERTQKVFDFLVTDHYKEIYKLVKRDSKTLKTLLNPILI